MTQYTAGPWFIDPRAATHIIAEGRPIASAGGYMSNTKPDLGEGENQANAQLISAAPDLLQACIVATNSCGYLRLNSAARKLIEAAIAKAKGEDQ